MKAISEVVLAVDGSLVLIPAVFLVFLFLLSCCFTFFQLCLRERKRGKKREKAGGAEIEKERKAWKALKVC